MPQFIDLTGSVFGRLTVIDRAENDKRGQSQWNCICSCGAKVSVNGYRLRTSTRSCGCLRHDYGKLFAKHSHTGSKTWVIWAAMRRRCRYKKHDKYDRYGGRGITVCERWDEYTNFLSDMGERPDGYTLERIDNDGNYEPGNCRWATKKEQARNRSSNHFLEIYDSRKCLAEWAEISGTCQNKIRDRLKRGWPPKEAVFGRKHVQNRM